MSDWRGGRMTHRVVAGALLAGWLLSLALPALAINVGHDPNPPLLAGWEILRGGGISLATFQFGWLGNPLLLLVLAMLAWGKPSRDGLRFVAGMLAICTLDTLDLFLRPSYYFFEGAFAGYYLWAGVNLLATLVAFLFSAPLPRVADDPNSSKATIP